jgi:hypothetical protein
MAKFSKSLSIGLDVHKDTIAVAYPGLFVNAAGVSRTGGGETWPRGPQRKGPTGGWVERGPEGPCFADRTRPTPTTTVQ